MRLSRGEDSSLKSFVTIRVLVATVLLGSGAAIYFGNGSRTEAFYLAAVLALVYFLSLVYLIFSSFYISRPGLVKGIQLFFDILLATFVIFLTGGKSSPFIFLYVVIIFFSSLTVSRLAGYIVAGISGILYLFIVLYDIRLDFPAGFDIEILTSPFIIQDRELWKEKGIVSTYFHLTGFILISILSGYVSQRIQITRRELSESRKSLSILQNLHENILQNLTSGVITVDLEGRVISLNRKGLEILEINNEEELIGNKFSYIMPGTRIDDLISKRREQVLYTTPSGKKSTLGFSTSKLRDNLNKTQGYIIIFQDLTDVKELEDRVKDSEKLALLGQLAAGLAHELRNPLSAISGAVEIISKDMVESEDNERLIKVASQEVERLNLLVEDFLILTVPIQSFSTAVDLGVLISETVDSFSKTMRRKDLNIVTDLESGTYVLANSYRIKQAIWNLLLNSMDAMPTGGTVTIRTRVEGENIQIELADDGMGISNKVISKVFDPFFTTKQVGTGLGLAIVQKVVEGYNGKINIMSSKGKGTTLIINFPKVDNVPESESRH